MRDTLDTNVPPFLPLKGGREYYLPEVYYFFDSKEVSLDDAVRVTALSVVQWCDRYRVEPLTSQRSPEDSRTEYPGREGALPPTVPERQRVLRQLFEWLEQTRGPNSVEIDLFDRDEAILFQDGLLFYLAVTPPQFAELQDCWAAHGLPRDLFYPRFELRDVVEPVEWMGSVVRMVQHYTPHRWASRLAEHRETPPVPTEAESERALLDAIQRFIEAVLLRRQELQEPGKQTDEVELRRLNLLELHVSLYRQALEGRVPESELQKMCEDFLKSYASVYNVTR